MTLFAQDLSPPANLGWQIAAAVMLGGLGMYFMLPKPRHRQLAIGIFLSIAAAVVATLVLLEAFGRPTSDRIADALFWLFSAGAIIFGVVLVTQRNPARGAIAFAFVILSTCGLFLLLAAPFLMATTIIIYAGAIIVTFLFVLMLSQTQGTSDENDRSREPLIGSLAGFAFTGLILFTLYLGSPAGANAEQNRPLGLPALVISADDRTHLTAAIEAFTRAGSEANAEALDREAAAGFQHLSRVVGMATGEPVTPLSIQEITMQERLRFSSTIPRVMAILDQADRLRDRKKVVRDRLENAVVGGGDLEPVRADLLALRDEAMLLRGYGELPARNVSAVGRSLYTEHLLSVELAGALLLVATIGAVAIAGRKGQAA